MKLTRTKTTGVYYRASDVKNDKCYYISYYVNGKSRQEKIGWQSEGYNISMAQDIRNERIRQIRHSEFVVKDITLSESCDHYLSSIKTKRSYPAIKMQLEYFKKYIGSDRALKDITSHIIIDYIKNLTDMRSAGGKRFSGQTVAHYFKAVRQMFNYCIDTVFYKGRSPINRQITKNLPKFNNTIVNYFKDGEDRAILKVLDSYSDKSLANFFRFAFFSGMREGELFNLKWHDVDTNKGYLVIRESKSGKDEFIALNDALFSILENQRIIVPKDVEYVFPNRFWRQRTNIQKQFCTLKKEAGIIRPFRFHDLRHNFASLLIEGGASLYDVQIALTHKDPKTTQKYAHLKNDRKRQISNIAVNIIQPCFVFDKE